MQGMCLPGIVLIVTTLLLQLHHSHQFIVNKRQLGQRADCFKYKSGRFIPDSFEVRVEEGKVSAYELEKLFTPNKLELQHINRLSSTGFAGLILSLEGVLINVDKLYVSAFGILAQEMDLEPPSVEMVLDVISLTFRDAINSLGILTPSMENIDIATMEVAFYSTMNRMIDDLPMTRRQGSTALLEQLIIEGNEIAVISSLPKDIAQKALGKSGLSALFEDNVPTRNLICRPPLSSLQRTIQKLQDDAYDPMSQENFETSRDFINAFNPTYGDRFYQGQLLKACGRLYKSPTLVASIDSSRKHLLCAKKAGMTAIALRGQTRSAQYLRGADLYVDGLQELSTKDIYRVVRRALEYAQGPAQQQAVAVQPANARKLQTMTPLEDAPETLQWTSERDDDALRRRGTVTTSSPDSPGSRDQNNPKKKKIEDFYDDVDKFVSSAASSAAKAEEEEEGADEYEEEFEDEEDKYVFARSPELDDDEARLFEEVESVVDEEGEAAEDELDLLKELHRQWSADYEDPEVDNVAASRQSRPRFGLRRSSGYDQPSININVSPPKNDRRSASDDEVEWLGRPDSSTSMSNAQSTSGTRHRPAFSSSSDLMGMNTLDASGRLSRGVSRKRHSADDVQWRDYYLDDSDRSLYSSSVSSVDFSGDSTSMATLAASASSVRSAGGGLSSGSVLDHLVDDFGVHSSSSSSSPYFYDPYADDLLQNEEGSLDIQGLDDDDREGNGFSSRSEDDVLDDFYANDD